MAEAPPRANHLAEIEAILFDLDGTLYATPARFKIQITWRLRRDIPILRHLGAARDAIRMQTFAGSTPLLNAFYAELAHRSGHAPLRCRCFYEERFLPTFVDLLADRARAREGLGQTLAKLRLSGIQLAVLSDYGAIADRLRALDVDPAAFDLLLAAEETGSLKPSARPFMAAAATLGCQPAQTMVVGDRGDMDEAGAAAAGMHFCGVADTASSPFAPWLRCEARLLSLRTPAPSGPPSAYPR